MTAVVPSRTRALADQSGAPTQEVHTWMQDVTEATVLIGTGTPEAVIEAVQGRFYIDTAGTTGTMLYIKRDADTLGDKTKGWLLA